ncbi:MULTISPECIES: hypothetical protein [Curtobacterium]|jgi:hypothetical protein|uniref:hypothetical protein n=2 Tax=Microbacteriaceae TaxID=85023 RepID=UPI000DA9E290|nr:MULTISPECIES: hypothetical protein [Curtobacterium]MBT1582894.1 hypothetical protein [Curtobacterium flaccumfaciens pv. flaccumfaciens]MBT1605467.1 hypothetical protein [Curtobacterium flaccumfaciens pv. betae]MBT1632929.1 hypothetical protein [Curtobacterium flaccumfaciens pv. oortii]MBT1656246.1 hypothetical protein [Curtobacterium flaccumfaciens pv. betae]MCE0456497.1 hypothetical protein [Curtobacterium allii]
MARSPRERYGTVDLASADVVLAGTQELLPVLRAAAVRAGIDAARMRVIGVDDLPDPDETWDAALAVIAIRRPGDDPAFHRAQAAAELIAPMLAPHAVRIVVTVSGVTRLAPKLERTLTSEVLHQIDAASASSGFRRPFRPLRMRLGLAGLRAAGVRVFRVSIGD